MDAAADKEAEANFIAWYEDICKERIFMLEVEEAYKRRIADLESSSAALLKSFQEVEHEVSSLRSKYEAAENTEEYKEPYTVVFEERQTLLNTVKGYKKRIETLEKEIQTLQKYIKGLDIEKPVTTNTAGKVKNKKKALIVITCSERMEFLETENQKLKFEIGDIANERALLQEHNKKLEQKLKDTEKVSLTTARNCEQIHGEAKRKHKRDEMASPKLPEVIFKRSLNTYRNNVSAEICLPSIKITSSVERGLKYGLDYKTLNKGRSLSKRSTSTGTGTNSSTFR